MLHPTVYFFFALSRIIAISSESIRSSKLRKRAAMPSEMLYGDACSNGDKDKNSQMISSFTLDTSKFNPLTRVPSAPGPLK